MALSHSLKRTLFWVILPALVLSLLAVIFREPLVQALRAAYHLVIDREKMEAVITASGPWGPLVFMGIQIAQVILAPIPGEATGFIGGYLFGAAKGFVFSSISLALGSLANFLIGRLLGRRFIRRIIPADKRQRMDQMVTHNGALVIMLLFIFPGFPKDYLCLFLGVTAMPIKLFVLMATFGRMPGTLMLSLQGAMLFERMYGLFAIMLGVCGLIILLAYRYRERVYAWIENLNRPGRRRR